MKKLTAGIFAGILAVVSVNAARADIATTTYVGGAVTAAKNYADTQVGALQKALVTDGSETVKHAEDAGALTTAATATTIRAVDTAEDTKYATEKAVATAVAGVSGNLSDITGKVTTLEGKMSAAEGNITMLTNTSNTHTTDISELKDALDNTENGLRKQISNHANDISALEGRMDTAETDITGLKTDKQDKSNSEVTADTAAATKADNRNVIANSAEVNKNLVALDTAIGTINQTISTNQTAAENAIKGLTGTGDGTTTGNGMVKMVTQANGVVTATRGLVAETDLATDLATKINDKATKADLDGGDGTGAKTAEQHGVIQSVTETDGIVTATRGLVAETDINSTSVTKWNTAAEKAAANETAIGSDAAGAESGLKGRIKALETKTADGNKSLSDKMDLAPDANGKPLAVNSDGQVVAGTITNTCAVGKTCILVPTADGQYKYEVLATEYKEGEPQA